MIFFLEIDFMFSFIYFYGFVFFQCFFEELDVLLGVASFGLCKYPFFFPWGGRGGGWLGGSAWCVSVMVCEF